MAEKKRLKVLQVASSLLDIGGIENQVALLSKGLQDRGHEIHITCWPGTWLWEQAEANGIKAIPLRVRHQQDWLALGSYLRVLRKGKYDIVHVHFSPDFIIVGLAAKLLGIRGLLLTRRQCSSWRKFNRWLYGGLLYPKFIAVSEAVRQALISSGVSADKVVTVYNGVIPQTEPVKSAQLKEKLGLPVGSFLIGTMARLAQGKGHRCMIDIMPELDPRAVYIIGGSGPDEEALLEYVKKKNLLNRVKFLGWRKDKYSIFVDLDILVHPCTWEEACCGAIIDAMSMGVPVVATASGGNAELVSDGVTGLIVPKKDTAALVKAISDLMSDPGRCKRMGEEAIKKQQSLFTTTAVAANVEKVYMNLLKFPENVAESL
jgi:glycosyltransferase involved in cell wall biosynthesis